MRPITLPRRASGTKLIRRALDPSLARYIDRLARADTVEPDGTVGLTVDHLVGFGREG